MLGNTVLKTSIKNRYTKHFIKWFVIVNAVFFLIFLLVIILFDVESAEGELSIGRIVLDQGLLLLLFLFTEILLTGYLVFSSFIKRQSNLMDSRGLIDGGESASTEFKSSLRWDFQGGKIGKYIEESIAKTIAGFLNSSGGTLFIGVDDNGNVVGLDKDYTTLRKQDRDGFMLQFSHIIRKYLGSAVSGYLQVEMTKLDDKDICRIDVSPSNGPVYFKGEMGETFFVRSSTSTQPLSISEAHKYISNHW